MTIKVRKVCDYKNVEVNIDRNTIDLGLLTEEESKNLAAELLSGAYDLMRSGDGNAKELLIEMLDEMCG